MCESSKIFTISYYTTHTIILTTTSRHLVRWACVVVNLINATIIARHGPGGFANVYWCALLGHAFTHKLNSTCISGDLLYVPTHLERIRSKWAKAESRAIANALARMRAVRAHEKYVAHATCGDLYYVDSKFEETSSLDKQTLNHVRARTCALARVQAVGEHDKCVAHITCGYL
jgi:hypothetical protein